MPRGITRDSPESIVPCLPGYPPGRQPGLLNQIDSFAWKWYIRDRVPPWDSSFPKTSRLRRARCGSSRIST